MVAAPAFAVTDRWAAWDPVAGSSNAFTTTMRQQAPGFPAAAVATDSRAPVQLPSGSSAFLGPGTPPGAKYGTSSGNPYLVLRARADTATTPSTTTYSFDAPTPDTGWAFVLGDIDADAVRIAATDEAGAAVPAAEVASWFAGTFNYAGAGDLPTWDPTSSTLTGNAAALDTNGASGWFEPDVRLTSLTFIFSRRAGFPVYQAWFVSRARPIGGVVSDLSTIGTCPPTQATVSLLSPSGTVLATVTPAGNGSYSFGEFATQGDYVVRVDVPDTCAVIGAAQQTVSNRGNDNDPASRANFGVRAVVPQVIRGTVRDNTGAPVAGVVVTITRPGGGTATTTTAADGTYLFDNNPTAPGYTVSIAVPSGYVAGPAGTQITGITVTNQPVTGQDFVLVDLPSVSGTVSGGGAGIGGVEVVLAPAGGGPLHTAATQGDGGYVIDDLPPGDYTLDVVEPADYTAPPPRTITVPAGGLTGQDVVLIRPGSVGGSTTYAGAPAPGVEIVVDGPGGPRVVTTDAEGVYFVDQLTPGTYTVTVRPPAGAVVVGPSTRTVVITAAGEIRGGQDFVLAAAPPSPTPTPSATPTASPSPTDEPSSSPTDDGGDDGELPDTGGPSGWLATVGGGVLLAGLALVAAGRRRGQH